MAENTYPGCGVDIPAPVYSFSFNPNPQWRSNFALQPELLSYIDETVDKFGVRSKISMHTELIEAAWSEDRRRWVLDTTQGTMVAQHVIFAAGPITEPKTPELPGIDSFAGEIFHSARWNHDVDLTGKRVAVVGTGASAVQFIPEINRTWPTCTSSSALPRGSSHVSTFRSRAWRNGCSVEFRPYSRHFGTFWTWCCGPSPWRCGANGPHAYSTPSAPAGS